MGADLCRADCASPADLNETFNAAELGGISDHRTLDKLVDGQNVVLDDYHCWMTTLPSEGTRLNIDLRDRKQIVALRFWNYQSTKTFEDTQRGVQHMEVSLDDELLCRQIRLRQAPGHASFDFGQTVALEPGALRSWERPTIQKGP